MVTYNELLKIASKLKNRLPKDSELRGLPDYKKQNTSYRNIYLCDKSTNVGLGIKIKITGNPELKKNIEDKLELDTITSRKTLSTYLNTFKNHSIFEMNLKDLIYIDINNYTLQSILSSNYSIILLYNVDDAESEYITLRMMMECL